MARVALRIGAVIVAGSCLMTGPVSAAECSIHMRPETITTTVDLGEETYIDLEPVWTLIGYDREVTTTSYEWRIIGYDRVEPYDVYTWKLIGYDRLESVIVDWVPVYVDYVSLHSNHYVSDSGDWITNSCPGQWWWVQYPYPHWDPAEPDCGGHGNLWVDGTVYYYAYHDDVWDRGIYLYYPIYADRWVRYGEPPGNEVWDWVRETAYRTIRYPYYVPGSTPVYDWVPVSSTSIVRYPDPPGTPVYDWVYVPVVRTRRLTQTLTTVVMVPYEICVEPT